VIFDHFIRKLFIAEKKFRSWLRLVNLLYKWVTNISFHPGDSNSYSLRRERIYLKKPRFCISNSFAHPHTTLHPSPSRLHSCYQLCSSRYVCRESYRFGYRLAIVCNLLLTFCKKRLSQFLALELYVELRFNTLCWVLLSRKVHVVAYTCNVTGRSGEGWAYKYELPT